MELPGRSCKINGNKPSALPVLQMVSALGKTGRFAHVIKRGPCSPMAEAEDLKSSKCGFDPHRGHAY